MPAFGFGLASSEVLPAVERCVTYEERRTQLLSVVAAATVDAGIAAARAPRDTTEGPSE
jgi:hypothetical protein